MLRSERVERKLHIQSCCFIFNDLLNFNCFLLEKKNGQTPLAIAQKLGYISVVEELKLVTQTTLIQTTTKIIEEKYKVQAPETMQETFMSDSEDELGKSQRRPLKSVRKSTIFRVVCIRRRNHVRGPC